MILLSVLALGCLQSKPKLAAVQLWNATGPVRAWSLDGKALAKTISVERADNGLPSKPGAVELVAFVPCTSQRDFPSAYWTAQRGFKRTSESSSWKDGDQKSGIAAFSLLGIPDASEAAVVLNISNGPLRDVAGPEVLQLNTWKSIAGGFRARIRNRAIVQEGDGEHAKHAFLELILPQKYRDWEISPLVLSNGDQLSEVAYDGSGLKRTVKLEREASQKVTLTIRARSFVPFHFDHIHLRPR